MVLTAEEVDAREKETETKGRVLQPFVLLRAKKNKKQQQQENQTGDTGKSGDVAAQPITHKAPLYQQYNDRWSRHAEH